MKKLSSHSKHKIGRARPAKANDHAGTASVKAVSGGQNLVNEGAGSPGVDCGVGWGAGAALPLHLEVKYDKASNSDQKLQQSRHLNNEALIPFRTYQKPVFLDRETGIIILHWSRQIGKSYTLAAWAVDRLLDQLTKHDSWLITVLSNSKDNGSEFVLKCAEACNKLGIAEQQERATEIGDAAVYNCDGEDPTVDYHNMRMEVRIQIGQRVGRIKVLAANPRTARGFSGDLILDEFAFHEDSNAIWEAAEPIISANPEYLCRIASTGNGKHNMFYRMVSALNADGSSKYKIVRVSRSEAWRQGVKIYDANTRKPITPDEARAQALDKRAYDQNYELAFGDENMALLTHELISSAERQGITIDSQAWTQASINRMFRAKGDIYAGLDIGRNRDLSVLCVIEKMGQNRRVIAMLRMENMRLPAQQVHLYTVCRMPKFRRMDGDMTGLGLGLIEYAQELHGESRVRGVNFATTEPVTERMKLDGRNRMTARVTEIMASRLVEVFEDKSIDIPIDEQLRDDLRKPERLVSPGGRVSIAALRDGAGHADHFWSLALAVRASEDKSGPFAYKSVCLEGTRFGRGSGLPC